MAYWSEFSGATPEWSCPLRLPSMDAFSLSGVGILIMAWRVSLCAGVLIYISLWQWMPAVLTFVRSLRWSKYLCLFYPFSNLIIYVLLLCSESSLFVLDISPLLGVCGFVFFWDKVLLCGSVWPQTPNSWSSYLSLLGAVLQECTVTPDRERETWQHSNILPATHTFFFLRSNIKISDVVCFIHFPFCDPATGVRLQNILSYPRS